MGFSKNIAKTNLYACRSIEALDKALAESCNLCCMSPYNNVPCDCCPVQQLHDCLVEKLKAEIKTSKEQ